MQDDSDSSSLAAYLSEKNQSTTEELTTEQTRHVNLTSYLEEITLQTPVLKKYTGYPVRT